MILSVDINTTTAVKNNGRYKQCADLSGYILVRKTDDFRVILFAPIAHIRAFDMVSNHETFRMAIPAKNRYVIGLNRDVPPHGGVPEGLRPRVLQDSILIRGVETGQAAALVADDSPSGHEHSKIRTSDLRNYRVSILQPMDSPREMRIVRSLQLDPITFLPAMQDMFDGDGKLETRIIYGHYHHFAKLDFPTSISIWRPRDRVSISLTIKNVILNQSLDDGQFSLKFPEGAKVENQK